MKALKVKIKRMHPDAVIPSYAKPGDAGLDLTAISYEKIDRNTLEYRTGLAVEIPEGYVGLVFPRSSVSVKPLVLANSVGVIDSGYRGEIRLRFRETGSLGGTYTPYLPGDRIGQLVIIPYPRIELEEAGEAEKLGETDRGSDGFGSTGD